MATQQLPTLTLKVLKLIVQLQETHHLTQGGIAVICDAVTDILSTFATDLESAISTQQINLGPLIRLEATKIIANHPMSGVNSEHKILSLLGKHCGLILPKPVLLSEGYKTQLNEEGQEFLVDEETFGAIVPFKKTLEKLYSNNEVRRFLDTPYSASTDGIIRSVKDGTVYKSHPVCQKYPNCLLVQMYEDDLEVANPLGSHVKVHKLTNVYWMLLNIPDHLRSNLKAINLLGIAKAENTKEFGFESLLSDFLENMNILESEDGLRLEVNGNSFNVHGALINVNGDGLALNSIGGFKESFGLSFKPCRTCSLSRPEMNENFVECNLRTLETHTQTVSDLDNWELTKAEKVALSRDTGVTGPSVLSCVKSFDVTKMLPHDFMHDGLEGVAEVELQALLCYLISNQITTLEILNHQIKSFPFPRELLQSKPTKIEKSHLENNLRQNASQMICLLVIMPFILAPFSNEKTRSHISNFVLLAKIANRLMAYEIPSDSLAKLRLMILMHHTRFVKLYPSVTPTPKFHFLVHAPSVISKFGPIRVSWCMRYEGLNAWFSKNAQATKNFINIVKSLSQRFQVKKCMDMGFGDPSHCMLEKKSVFTDFYVKLEEYKLGAQVARVFECNVTEEVRCVRKLHIKNFAVEVNSVLLYETSEMSPPSFAVVVAIFTKNNVDVLVLKLLKTIFYDDDRNAYEVKKTSMYKCMRVNIVPSCQTYPIVQVHGKDYVIPMYSDVDEFMG